MLIRWERIAAPPPWVEPLLLNCASCPLGRQGLSATIPTLGHAEKIEFHAALSASCTKLHREEDNRGPTRIFS
jgi:hypothetical protein